MALLKWLALFIQSYVDLKLKRGLKYEVCQIKGVRCDFPECYDLVICKAYNALRFPFFIYI